MSLIYYNSYQIFCNNQNKDKRNVIPGGNEFFAYFELFSQNITCIDRTGVMNIPLKTEVMDFMKMPEYKEFDKSFSEICDDRAKYLLQYAEWKNKKIAVMYSGGVDSTLMLCSFLKNAKQNQLKNIIVLLSDESIRENVNFYNNYVIKNFICISSWRFPYLLGKDEYLFLTGENADQLFGSQVNGDFTIENPYTDLFEPIELMEGKILDFFRQRLLQSNKKLAEPMFNLFKKMANNAPVKLENIYQMFWWINFTTKWQSVYMRILPFSLNLNTLKLQENYTTFYHTDEFQLWSLNNMNKFSSSITHCGKMIPKEYIFDFNGDEEYLKKPKVGSLTHLARRKGLPYTIDSNMKVNFEYPTEEYYNYENSFVEMK